MDPEIWLFNMVYNDRPVIRFGSLAIVEQGMVGFCFLFRRFPIRSALGIMWSEFVSDSLLVLFSV